MVKKHNRKTLLIIFIIIILIGFLIWGFVSNWKFFGKNDKKISMEDSKNMTAKKLAAMPSEAMQGMSADMMHNIPLPDKRYIAEPKNIDSFWQQNKDRIFMLQFYPKLKKFKTILDIGARDYTYRCKNLIGSADVKYIQMEPYPPKKLNNDGLLECRVQESLKKFPKYTSFFDVVVDFGVLGWGTIELTSIDIIEYIKNVRGLLKEGGMYVLKVDPSGKKRLDFSKYIEPYFEYQDFGGWKNIHKVDVYDIYFLKKKKVPL